MDPMRANTYSCWPAMRHWYEMRRWPGTKMSESDPGRIAERPWIPDSLRVPVSRVSMSICRPNDGHHTFSSHLACTDNPHALHVFPCLLRPQMDDCQSGISEKALRQ